MTDEERCIVLDAVALIEAQAHHDREGAAAILCASDDPVYLRRVTATLAYMATWCEDLARPELLGAIRRKFAH